MQKPVYTIGIGMWLALIMVFNVWFIIWPNQQKVLGLVEATDARAAAGRVAGMTSRINTMLSIPMLYCMMAQQNAGLLIVLAHGRHSRRPVVRTGVAGALVAVVTPVLGAAGAGVGGGPLAACGVSVTIDFATTVSHLSLRPGRNGARILSLIIAMGLPYREGLVGLGRRRMSVTLLILGIVVAVAGLATIGFGSTISEFSLGTTSIIAGTTALTGGLILIGLSAVVTELGRVAEAMRTRPLPRPVARPTEATEATAPALPAATPAIATPAIATPPVAVAPAPPPPAANGRQPPPNIPMAPRPRPEAPAREARPAESYPSPPPSAVEVSAAAIERLRSSIPRSERPRAEPSLVTDDDEVPLSPNGASHHPAVQRSRPASAEPAPPPLPRTADERAVAPAEAPKGSRLDFLFRSRPAARSAPQSETFEAFWPADARSGRNAGAEPQSRVDEVQRHSDYTPAQPASVQAPPMPERRAEPTPVEAAAILKSGVVDGMAYTLYADGSIEAKLPHGTVRFGSIGELRAHIESNS